MTEAEYPPELPKHKVYELVVTEVLKRLDAGAIVQHNAQVPVVGDDRTRQIDVYVRGKIGGFPHDLLIDCKHYAKPLDVKSVDEFIGMMDDIKPNMGVLVGLNGFTDGAQKRARKEGKRINLCSVFIGGRPEFSVPVGVTLTKSVRAGGQIRVRLQPDVDGPVEIQVPADQRKFVLEDAQGGRHFVDEVAYGILNNDADLAFQAEGTIKIDTSEYRLVNGEDILPLRFLEVDFRIPISFYKRQVQFTDGAAVVDAAGKIVAATNMTSDWERTDSLEGWEQISEDEAHTAREAVRAES